MKKIAFFTVLFIVFVFCVCFFACERKKTSKSLVVLINSVPAQQRYLKYEVLGGFEKLYNCKVNLVNYENEAELQNMFLQDSAVSQITLVSVPFEMMESLEVSKKFTPFSEIVVESVLQFDAKTYYQKFVELGKIDGNYYCFPHRIEIPILFYMKSKVAAAIEIFPKYRKEIDSVLKKENGFGLPTAFILEENPNEWDLYDIFAIGYIWANEEINDKKNSRILSLDIFDKPNADKIVNYAESIGVEADLWEEKLKKYKIFHQLPDSVENLSLAAYSAIKNGDIFMVYFQQNDCFNVLEGTDESNMLPYVSDVSDVGIALIPSAVSFSLDEDGYEKITGVRVASINGFGWGIPKSSKEKELAYHLIQYLNNRSQHTRESIRFGSIPVREDVFLNMKNIYDEKWLGEGFAVAVQQITDVFTEKKDKEK